HLFFDIRPHIATLLFVAVILLLHDRTWAPWLWPPLIALWANVHGGFVFGIATIGLLGAGRTRAPRGERRSASGSRAARSRAASRRGGSSWTGSHGRRPPRVSSRGSSIR